jgi:hypothetical protein
MPPGHGLRRANKKRASRMALAADSALRAKDRDWPKAPQARLKPYPDKFKAAPEEQELCVESQESLTTIQAALWIPR